MYKEKLSNLQEGYTFDDVLLIPGRSSVEPRDAVVETMFSRKIRIKLPIVSSPMDTVSEYSMAIAMARFGGIGVLHRNLKVHSQIQMVQKVKREE